MISGTAGDSGQSVPMSSLMLNPYVYATMTGGGVRQSGWLREANQANGIGSARSHWLTWSVEEKRIMLLRITTYE